MIEQATQIDQAIRVSIDNKEHQEASLSFLNLSKVYRLVSLKKVLFFAI
jgi:CO dehydrogenase/acetyl-CoA synthase epsilon subunit